MGFTKKPICCKSEFPKESYETDEEADEIRLSINSTAAVSWLNWAPQIPILRFINYVLILVCVIAMSTLFPIKIKKERLYETKTITLIHAILFIIAIHTPISLKAHSIHCCELAGNLHVADAAARWPSLSIAVVLDQKIIFSQHLVMPTSTSKYGDDKDDSIGLLPWQNCLTRRCSCSLLNEGR